MGVRARIAALLDALDLEDPHEFCTAYVDHVESSACPVAVAVAAHQWVRDGYIGTHDLWFSHR